ncbi:MAG: glycosyltransferase family 39 protein [Rivularia sp. (in: cyanobacteria)]
MMKIKIFNKHNYILIAILVIAAVLRLNHITQPFTDYIGWRQTSTAMMADNFYRTNWNIFYPETSWDGPGPSYQGREFQTITYISALLYVILGQHDWIGRGVAVAFGLWGIFALYQLVRQVWGENYALASAAVMAILPGSVFVERSFLPDPAMVSLVVTAFWVLIKYLNTEKIYYLILGILIGTWSFLTKIPGLIVGIPMLYSVFTILSKKHQLNAKKLIPIATSAIFILLPVVFYYLWAKHLAETYPPYHFAGGGNWIWDYSLKEWLDKKYYFPSLTWNFNRWIWTKPFALLVLLGIVLPPPYSKWSGEDNKLSSNNNFIRLPWIFHWWVLGFSIFYLIGAKELVINAWNFHSLNPAAAAFAGHALIKIKNYLSNFLKTPASLAIILAILFIFGGYGQKKLNNMYFPPEAEWDGTEGYKMGLVLKEVSKPGELVVTVSNDIGEPVPIYYSSRRGWVFPPPLNEINWTQMVEDKQAIKLFEDLRRKGADWFGIVQEHREKFLEEHPVFMEYITKTCSLAKEDLSWGVIYKIPDYER